ncbi:MAG TPA: DUF4232 domain-containing protein [Jatrophihabitans sp.]|jgi:hypothetical protein|nr:DUF4232 domain-containing protein [Jatrophihabitans sp.]
MSKKTLPDELRSVLLAHSLDAPEPGTTVDRILAATVGGVAVDGTVTKRWWMSNQLLAAAVVIGLLVLGVGGYTLHNLGGPQRAASNTAGGANAPVNGSAGLPSTGLGQLGKNNQNQQLPVPVPTPPTDLPCTSIPGGHPVVGAHTSFTLTSTGESRYVYEFLCIGTNGTRSASELQVFQPAPGGRLSYLSTMVPVGKDGHLEYLSAVPNGVRVQGTDQSAGPRPGDVVSVTYTTADGGRSFTSTGKLVAKACQKTDLSARVVTADGGVTGRHQVLQLTNLTVNPCGLEGYPSLVALVNGAPSGPMLNPTLSGPAGGVTSAKVPPIVVLIPGGTAAAIIELGSAHPTCASANQVLVGLPNGPSLGTIPADLSTCGLDVHPLVDNPYGTD